MAKTVIIPGRLHNPEQGNVVTGANEILDDTKGKKQNVINSEVSAELVRLDNSKQDNLTFDSTPTENSTNPVTSGGVYAAELTLSQAIEAILLLIPSAASALNKLVDTETMNSSIATATATFKGTYNLVTDLSLGVDATHEQIAAKLLDVITTADNNDYAFVQVPTNAGTPTEIRVTERYKFNGTAWAYEYDLNNSGFTAAQWAAINSGITALLVSKLSELPTATELETALAGKQAVLTFDNAPTHDSDNPVKSGGIYTAIKNETDARELSEQGLQQGISTNAGDISDIKDVLPSGATAANKLVDNNSMVSYVTTLISGISATFNVTSADGHITLHITQVDGEITSVTLTTSDIASAAALNLKASQADLEALASVVNTKAAQSDLTTLAGRVSVNETDISNLQAAYAGLTQSDIIVGALPASGVANKIYRVPGTSSYSDYMWNGSTYVLMATYNNAIDNTPTRNSNNLVKSGGVNLCVFNRVVFQVNPSYSYNGDTLILTMPTAAPSTNTVGYVLKNGYVIYLYVNSVGSATYTIPRNSNLVADINTGTISVVGSEEIGVNILMLRNGGQFKYCTGPLAEWMRGIQLDGILEFDAEPTMGSGKAVQSGGVAKYIFNHVFFQTTPTWTVIEGGFGTTVITIPALTSQRKDIGYVTQSNGTYFDIMLEEFGSQTFTVERGQFLILNIDTHLISVVNNNDQGRNIVLFRNMDEGLLRAEGILAEFMRRIETQELLKSFNSKLAFETVGSMNIVARLGYDVYNSQTPPESSIPSFKMAYEKGYRYMLADLRLTSDGVFVTGHDDDIRGFGARNADGTAISGEVKISEHTLSELNQYDYGIYKGSKYRGLKLLTINDFLKFCKFRNIFAVLELKIELTGTQLDSLKSLILGVMRDTKNVILVFGGSSSYWQTVIDKFPGMEMWGHIVDGRFTVENIDAFTNLQTNQNKLVLYQSPYLRTMEDITSELANISSYAVEHGIQLGLSEVTSLTELISTDTLRCLSYAAITRIETYYEGLQDGIL